MSYKKKLIYLVRAANGSVYLSLRIWLVIQVIMTVAIEILENPFYIDFVIVDNLERQTELRKSDLTLLVC